MSKQTPGPLHNVTGARPGPWIRQVLNDESEAYIHDKHCNAIARVYSLSDAHLIAAAPAMCEALKAILDSENSTLGDGGSILGSDYRSLLQAVLAQAEGGGHE